MDIDYTLGWTTRALRRLVTACEGGKLGGGACNGWWGHVSSVNCEEERAALEEARQALLYAETQIENAEAKEART